MNEKIESLDLEVHVDGEWFAGVCGAPEDAWKSALHYAATARDAERVEIVQVTRKVVYTQIRP